MFLICKDHHGKDSNMENNNYGYQQQYQQVQPVDTSYATIVKEFLTKTIVSCAIASLPVGSIIAIFMASKNREAILEYLDRGGLHTVKVKVCSCLSRAARYTGIGCTILWGVYFIYWTHAIAITLFAVIGTYLSN